MYRFVLKFCQKFNDLHRSTTKVMVEILQKSWFSLNFDRRMLKSQECIRVWCNPSCAWNVIRYGTANENPGFSLSTAFHKETWPFSKNSFSLFVIVLYCSQNMFSNNEYKWLKFQLRLSSKYFFLQKNKNALKVQMCFRESRSCFHFIVLYCSKSICFVTRRNRQSVSFCMQDIRGLSVSVL